jgi:hypothetical protein
MKIFKIQTTRIVSSSISQDFWVAAADEDEAREKLQDSGFSGYDSSSDGIEEGDQDHNEDDETIGIEIVGITEEEE